MINRALRLIKVIGTGEAPTAEESTDALTALNAMLKTWSVNRTLVYRIQEIGPFTLTGGTASYTVGTSGTINTSRPQKLIGGFIRITSNDYPLVVLAGEEYEQIATKSEQGRPATMSWDRSYPLINLRLWPTPDSAYQLYLTQWALLQQFADLTTDMTMAPEYEEAIVYNLGIRLAPEFGGVVTPEIIRIASEGRRVLAQLSSANQPVQVELGYMGTPVYDIARG